MERYLLFDSGCSLCTSIARQVEDASAGRLIARSLRDPNVRSMLDAVKPGWRWEPMVLEVEGDRRRVYAGVGMRLRLVQVLGPRRALRLVRIVQQATAFQSGRRGVLRLAGGLLASLALGGAIPRAVNADDGPETEPATRVFLPSVLNFSGSSGLLEQVKASSEFLELKGKLFSQTPTEIQRMQGYTLFFFDLKQAIQVPLHVDVYPYVIFVANQDGVEDVVRVTPNVDTKQVEFEVYKNPEFSRIVSLSDSVVVELNLASNKTEKAKQLAEQSPLTALPSISPTCELRCRWECRERVHHPGHVDMNCWSVCAFGCGALKGPAYWACGAACAAFCYVPAYDECRRWEKVCTREC